MNNVKNIKRLQQARNGIQFIVSPSVQQELQPFVFFDAGQFRRNDDGFTIDFHPHSGIGIITYFQGTDLHHRDSQHHDGVVEDGGVQWIRAGGGIWHQEGYHRKANQPKGDWQGNIHQLWMQLPPELEESQPEYVNLAKAELPVVDGVRVLSGIYKDVTGPLITNFDLTYLDISIEAGERWTWELPHHQKIGFVFPRSGEIMVNNNPVPNQTMGIMDEHPGELTISSSVGSAQFILVAAAPANYPLKSFGSSVHTNEDAYRRSRERMKEIGRNLEV
jgi:redox-sensitive bicupin YhaK (pirin superfamily)